MLRIAIAGIFICLAVRTLLRRHRAKACIEAADKCLDETLQNTFPASDPPASRNFSVPVNALPK